MKSHERIEESDLGKKISSIDKNIQEGLNDIKNTVNTIEGKVNTNVVEVVQLMRKSVENRGAVISGLEKSFETIADRTSDDFFNKIDIRSKAALEDLYNKIEISNRNSAEVMYRLGRIQ